MRNISGAGLLDLWESGTGLQPLDRGLLMLDAAVAESARDQLPDWPLGRRNSALASWRSAMFGPKLGGSLPCPACGERLEFEMDTRAIFAADGGSAPPTIEFGGRVFRLPATRDFSVAAAEANPASAALRVLQNCCLNADGTEIWTARDIEAVGELMAAADSVAETRLSFRCAACAHEWDESLDIAEFLWTELEASAKRLLRDVHVLASAYGWTEPAVLALSAARREAYIGMVEQ